MTNSLTAAGHGVNRVFYEGLIDDNLAEFNRIPDCDDIRLQTIVIRRLPGNS